MSDLPNLFLYTKPGCSLCDEARGALQAILHGRRTLGLPVPRVIERDITTNPDWERAFFTTIPVVDLADRRLELATSPARLRRLVADVLDADGGVPPVETATPLGG